MELRLFPDMMIPSHLVLQRLFLRFSLNLKKQNGISVIIKREECKIISGGIDVSCLPSEIKRVESFKAVGVPVGDEEFVSEFLEQKNKTIRAYSGLFILFKNICKDMQTMLFI